jgi:hypothetical protein
VRQICETAEGDEQLRAYALAADVYQVTGSVLVKFDDPGLAAFAAERSIEAASRSKDPLAVAASARMVTHSLMGGGHNLRAFEVSCRAAERLAAEVVRPDDAALSVYGARRIDVSLIPIVERKAALFLDTARAYAQWGKHEQAYSALRMANSVAPEEVRSRGRVRRLVGDLADHGPTSLRGAVRGFAEEIGMQL